MTPLSLGERIDDREGSYRTMQEGAQAALWTALPGIVQAFDATKGTVTVLPAIEGARQMPDGSMQKIRLPLLVDVPVVFQGGGGATLTFPIAQGDECLVIFASRCIDGWWQLGGAQPALDPRMHSLGDGFALVGVRSAARALPGLSTNSTQLRTDDGAMKLDFNSGTGRITATCEEFVVTGKIISQTEVEVGDIRLTQHRHIGVEAGGGTSGVPTA